MAHQGELLKKKVNDLKPDLQEFANYLEMTTQNLYNIYKKDKIKRSVLAKCCEFLKIDITIFEESPRVNFMFMDIGLKIKQLCEQKNISVTQIMDVLEYKSKTAVYDLYSKQHVNTEILEKLSTAFDIPLTYFFSETENLSVDTVNKNTEKVNEDINKDQIIIQNLENQVSFLQEEVKWLRGLVSNKIQDFGLVAREIGELRLVIQNQNNNGSVGKLAGSEREATTIEVTPKAIGERHHDALPTAVKVNQ